MLFVFIRHFVLFGARYSFYFIVLMCKSFKGPWLLNFCQFVSQAFHITSLMLFFSDSFFFLLSPDTVFGAVLFLMVFRGVNFLYFIFNYTV